MAAVHRILFNWGEKPFKSILGFVSIGIRWLKEGYQAEC
jgi:hypothetical protein